MAQFIINMEEAQKKSVRAQLLITDNMIAAFATYILLKSNSFPPNHPVWDGKPVGDQRWDAWKELFKPIQLALERKTASAVDATDIFGTAAVAQRLHGIVPGLPNTSGHGGDTHGLLELLDGQFDALMAALSTSNAALYQLAAATTQQYAEIKAVLTNLSAATDCLLSSSRNDGTRTGSLPSDQRETEKSILILQAAVKNKWKVGGFCSTHGHGVRYSHSSTNCNDKNNGHVNATTRSSTAGPGKEINKDRGDWLM